MQKKVGTAQPLNLASKPITGLYAKTWKTWALKGVQGETCVLGHPLSLILPVLTQL